MWIDDYDHDDSGDLWKQLVCQEIIKPNLWMQIT